MIDLDEHTLNLVLTIPAKDPEDAGTISMDDLETAVARQLDVEQGLRLTVEPATLKRPAPLEAPDFAPLIQMVDENLRRSEQDRYEDESTKHYLYEMVMITIYGPNFWEWRNKQKW